MKIAPLTFACAALAAAASVPTPRERAFEFEYSVTLKDLPDKAGVVDLWVPVPHDDPYQRIGALKFDAPAPFNIATGPMAITFSTCA